jgi:hypothetical protein
MSKPIAVEEAGVDDLYDVEIGDEDYGFIFGPDGELKSVFLPENMPFKTPKKIQRLLKMFGITDPGQLDDPTLH